MEAAISHYLTTMKQLCPGIPDQALAAFGETLYLKSVSKGDKIYEWGAIHDSLGFVYKGLVRAYYLDQNGNEKTSWFIKEDEFVTDYPAFLSAQPSKYIFEASEPATLVFLKKDKIQEAYHAEAAFQAYGRLIAEQVIQDLTMRIEDFLFLSAKDRYLLFMERNKALLNRISVTHMASMLGIERQSLTRIRKQLRDQD